MWHVAHSPDRGNNNNDNNNIQTISPMAEPNARVHSGHLSESPSRKINQYKISIILLSLYIIITILLSSLIKIGQQRLKNT